VTARLKRAVYYAAATLDGYIADPDDGLEWLLQFEGTYDAPDAEPEPMGEGGGFDRFYEGVGALVSGSATYEFVVEHFGDETWPYAGKPYWVLSSRDLAVPDAEGVDVRVVDASAEEVYGEVVASAGDRAVWLVGGGNVASQFADADLIEELIVTVVPVLLGDGKPLFDRPPSGSFQLLGVRPSANGMVELSYRLVG
jgi:dihydrofolate reductase